MKIIPEEILKIHADIQIGTYFSDVQSIGYRNIKYGFSKSIEDFYWNYAFNINVPKKDLKKVISQIKEFSTSIDRNCTIYITPDSKPKGLLELIEYKEKEDEVWMTMKEKLLPIGANLNYEVIYNQVPSNGFLNVFKDAYGGGSPDSPGYFGLPKEYVESIKNSKPTKAVNVAHFILKEKGEAAAIATIFAKGKYAGLYNVGTLHTKRRKGYGSTVSKLACRFGFSQGAKLIFLQTQAESKVEKMYKQIGFSSDFTGAFVTI